MILRYKIKMYIRQVLGCCLAGVIAEMTFLIGNLIKFKIIKIEVFYYKLKFQYLFINF